MNNESHLILYAKRFFSGTFLSRLSGMGRDLAMAFAFGDHASVAAFMVAFRFSNLLRRLFGEGPLQSAFIPHFEGLRSQDPSKSSFFFCKLVSLISILLIAITLIAEVGLATLLYVGDLSEGNQEIIYLTALLFPGILFICLYGLNLSLLNCYDSFFIPSFAPFLCNGIWIIAAIVLKSVDPSLAMITLTKWVVIGFIAQWLLTLPLTLKYLQLPWKEWFKIKLPEEVILLAKTFSLGALGVGAVQINALADAIFARYADIQGPAYLWYSIRLEQLALAIFGMACIATIAPSLSRAIKSDKLEAARDFFQLSYKRIILIMIPCSFAIIALGLASVNLLYGHGNFVDNAVLKTTNCLFAYGLGLLPTTLVLLFSTVFYANGNFRIPLITSVTTVILNLILNAIFVFGLHLGAVSTAIATSFSAWINFFVLNHLIKQMGYRTPQNLLRAWKMILASSCGCLCTFLVAYVLFDFNVFTSLTHIPSQLSRDYFVQAVCLSSLLIAFLGGFFTYAFISKNNEILELVQAFLPKSKARTLIKFDT